MATVDLSRLDGALKENYVGVTYDTIIRRSKILDLAKENSQVHDGPQGKYFKLSDLLGGNQGIGSRLESEFLPEGDVPQFINPVAYLKNHYARIDTTYQAMVDAVQGKAAFADWAKLTIVPTVNNFSDDLDRQLCGFGAGVFCRVSGAPSGTTVNIDRAFGADYPGAGSVLGTTKGWVSGVQRGMKLVAGPNLDGTGLRGGGTPVTVLAVDFQANSAGGALTVDNIGALTSGDYLFRGDAYGNNTAATGVEREMMGFEGLVDDGTLVDTVFGISRTAVPEWKSLRRDLNNAAVTEGNVMRALTDVGLYGGGQCNVAWTGGDEWRGVYNAIRGLGGFGANRDGSGVTAGAKGVNIETPFGSINLRGVERCVPGRAYFGDTSTLHRFVQGQGEWDTTAGGTMFRQVQVGAAVKDAYYAFYRLRMQFACDNPRKWVKVLGMNTSAF